ncbi:hypothetical protein SODALDRAFT_335426 [Sodiomyces alkalinus F11]|uniref:Uncharacterized protein n=1 Tax=Sodiomyces alkalinus (strain CBS 110278 / VKM F-3762 / F11) TaxID=1314773 RepID=A0A3N2PPG1_SODAK|nr:hypothetical protein SODALDRAFT_335426 [Sodiomyces alkalinus F11]ROT36324.1 hypothetical protein SODALDRAFT_335426 [Sodiomyces alkalinus F11]
MPLTMPLGLAIKSGEAICYGVATVGGFAPFYFMYPGADQRLANQTAKWAPRWEKNINYVCPTTERAIKRVEPPVARAVRAVEHRLPLERMAKGVERRLRPRFERIHSPLAT